MRIAITGRFENSYFSGATTQVAIGLARALVTAGHSVELLAPPKEALWFIDCKEHEASVPTRKNYNLSEIANPYDLLIEVVWNIGAQDRPKVAKKTILFAHYPPLFHDMESSVYQFNPAKRDFTNVHGMWTWDHYQPEDVRYLEFLSGLKVSKLSFIWDCQPLDIYEKEANLPPWSESAKEIERKLPSEAPSTLAWCLRITESNMSNSSSAVLPINIVSAIRGGGDTVRWMVHNGDGIAQSDFLKSNIIKNCNLGTDISGCFVGRLRLPDMRRDKTVLVAHQRWRPLKATLLDALYLGIPMIHNCQIAKSMGGSYYYELNQIQDAQEAWIRLKADAESGKGFFHPTAANVRKKALQGRFGPTSAIVQDALQAAIKQVETYVPVVRAPSTPSSRLKIAFVDMADSTFFYNLLSWAGANHNFTVEVTKTDPNLIIYGSTGTEHQAESWKSIPKIFYTGENTPAQNDYNTLLNLGCMYPKQGGTPYIRVPSWMLQIDWFRKDPSKIQIEDCIIARPSKWDRFASFVETDPGNPLRNAAFQIINQYKPVEAAGPLFCNRASGPIEESSKVEYYRSSKFVLAFENASSPGYCTEKLFHAKVAGAIPIYWGDPVVTNDFEEEGFFHAGKCGNGEDLVKQLKELDLDESRCKKMQAVPALSAKKRKECTATMGILAKAICAIGLRRDITVKEEEWDISATPTFTTVSTSVSTLVATPPSLTIKPFPQKQCFVTAANAKYIDSAKMLLDCIKDIPKVLYVWSDVPKESTASLTDVDVRILPTEEPWAGFWEPQHFAWKLWVLHDAGTKAEVNTNILYLDAGVFLASSIDKIWNQIEEQDVFLLDDDEQTNERWCHPNFCKAMSTTSSELNENQITAGLIGYKVGSRYQSELFEAALQIAKTQPDTIKGDKWKPYTGVCFGHRHDQSIVSILSSRCKAPRLPLRDFYCDHSLRRAQAWGTPLYVHRGQFKPFVPFTTGIGEVFLINADQDTEQLAKFKQQHSSLYKQVYKWRGTKSSTLSLNSSLTRLFRDNDFQWNKASMASAVNHLQLWEQCANNSHGQPYLILEDTVHLCSDWESKWKQAVASLPAEAEIVHLGSTVLCMTDPVNSYFRKRTGGTIVPSAYVLTQKGARNLIASIQQKGFYTTLEALLCEQSLYCMTSPLTISPQDVQISNQDITVAFTDMWPGFNYNTNFIMDALRQHTSTPLQGKNYTDCISPPSVVIIGPYSESWKGLPASIPKVFFTAENWNVPNDPRISLYLTPSKTEDATHMRLPTWMTFVDWYSGSTTLPEQSTDNPIRLPVHFAKTVPSTQERSQFCGFVVSNPVCKLRNDTFQVINNYKRVNSGGALYNNIGGQLALLYPGGGCGDLSKHHFFKQHKFTISFENSQAPGYITEKVLHSKMAGCIPLYWGDKDTDTDFAPNSIVNVSHMTQPEEVLEVLKQLEQDPTRCHQIATTPILNEASYQKALQILKSMSERILSLCTIPSSPTAISKTFVINLDTRQDRWKSLIDAEPSLQSYATRVSAVNGKTLSMNPMIYNLFQMNQFQWKKSIIGCNLSHISVWSQIANEMGDYFLVLEDDARFAPNWMETWKSYAKDIPADADLLYLGGILPPNKPALPSVLEPVNAHWATIKPNTLFSQTPVPLFHFCAYSYILRKSGAKKLMTYLTQSDMKSFTVSDHLLGHPSIGLKKYIATPLLTHCFQDSDPVYQQSHFNDLQRQDTFDSDIWNNKERFTELELMPYRESFSSEEVVTHLAAFMQPMVIPTVAPPVITSTILSASEPVIGRPVYTIPGTGLDCEKQWLEDMFQSSLSIKPIQSVLPTNSILLIQRTPPTFQQGKYKEILDAQTPKSIILLHISDEDGQDPILIYNHPSVKHVIRNYYRKDCINQSNITILPLGYSTKAHDAAPTFYDRSLVWSFAGSIDRPGRQEALSAMEALTPFEKQTKPTFGAPSPLKGSAYTDQLLKSKFIPAFKGFWSLESFRLYEALEAGCIPLYVPSEGKQGDEYTAVFGKSPILALPSWTQAPKLLEQLSKNPSVMEQHRQDLQTWWKEKKQSLQTTLSKILSS